MRVPVAPSLRGFVLPFLAAWWMIRMRKKDLAADMPERVKDMLRWMQQAQQPLP